MLIGDGSVHRDLDTDTQRAVLEAVTPALLAGELPAFGSYSWAQLADDAPAKHAATTRAALSWWSSLVFGPGVPADVVDRIIAERMNEASKSIAEVWPEQAEFHKEAWRIKVARGAVPDEVRVI